MRCLCNLNPRTVGRAAYTLLFAALVPVVAFSQPAVRPEASGSPEWRTTGGVKYTGVRYRSSNSRDSVREAGVFFDADAAQRGGIGGGIGGSRVYYNNGTPTLSQTNANISGRLYQRLSTSGDRIIYRLDAMAANNNDATGLTDGVRAIAPKIGYLTAQGTMFFDLEYARSDYRGNLSVRQFVPSLGFGFNQGYDWLSLRPYFIWLNDSTRALGKSRTTAMDATWTHYYGQTGGWMPSNVSLGALLGNRVYAVDTNTGSIANLANVQTSGFNLGVSWKLPREFNLGLYLGTGRFDEARLAGGTNSYSSRYANFTLTTAF